MAKISSTAEIDSVRIKEASAPSTPASGYFQIYAKTDGKLYTKNDAGTEVCLTDLGSSTAFEPWLVRILPTLDEQSGASGTWALIAFTNEVLVGPFVQPGAANIGAIALYNSSTAQNDYVTWDIVLSAGTWNATFFVRKSSNTGIITLELDGVSKGTVDTYSASIAYGKVSITGFTVSATGKTVLKVLAATKNASSSGYLLELFGISLRRTA